MNSKFRNVGRGVTLGFLALAACSSTKLIDVGRIDGNSGSGGNGTTSEAGSVGVSGKTTVADGGLAEVGNSQGGRGGSGDVPIEGGYGGEPGAGFVCEACELVAETPDIRGIWASSDRVYWIEYGGFDGLGNYENNGRLMSLAFEADEPTVVASGLQGPTQLGITGSYAYVIEDRSDSVHGELELTSVALDSGAIQVLQALPETLDVPYAPTNWFRRNFTAAGDSVFWRNGASIYRLVEGTTAPSVLVASGGLLTLLADDSQLFLQYEDGIQSVSLAGGTPTPVWASSSSGSYAPLSLVGDYFYAATLESHGEEDTTYFARLPKAGGNFKRLAEGLTPWVNRLVTDGTTYVADAGQRSDPHAPVDSGLVEGRLLDPDSSRTLATAPNWHDEQDKFRFDWRAWDATPTTVYVGYGDRLYRVARQP